MRRTDRRQQPIENEIAHLRDLDPMGLRARWLNEFGRQAPKHLTRHLLFKILTYKAQADRFGDLDATTLKVLRLASDGGGKPSASLGLAALDQRRFVPPAGTVLLREWDRTSHRVTVLADGFSWNGKAFDSLSQIAFAITGTKWNGPRFFGLRGKRPAAGAGDAP